MTGRRIASVRIAVLVVLFLNFLPLGGQAGDEAGPILTVYGAAGRVSGSLSVLDTGQKRWMIDCGAFYPDENDRQPGREERAGRESAVLPAEAAAIDGLFLTHAHLDHIGRVPLLVERGFDGPIYLTPTTAALAEVMLLMQVRFDRQRQRTWAWSTQSRDKAATTGRSLYVHWRPCSYRQAIHPKNLATLDATAAELAQRFLSHQPPIKTFLCPSCAKEEVASICRRFRRLEYDKPTEVAPGVRVTMLDAGHLPGSASVLFEVASAAGPRRILFSGDLGNQLSALFSGPQRAPGADAIVLETTYGATERPASTAAERGEFRKSVGKITRAGGVAWIPAFTLDRTQKILYELHLAQREGALEKTLPIFCPSPTAQRITALYHTHRQDGWFRPEVAANPLAWEPQEIRKTVPSYLPRPSIVISPSDMTTAVWSERLLASLLPDASTGIFLVGYQDPVGEGGQLERGVRQLEIRGTSIPVRAQVYSFHCFSGHGDAADIDRWLANVPPEALIVLVHGGSEELEARATSLRAQGRTNVQIAQPGKPIPIQRANNGR